MSLRTFIKGTLNHSSSFINAELYKRYGLYDENLKIVSDWNFFLIAIGLNNSCVKYINGDVAFFAMNGISNTNNGFLQLERDKVIAEIIPYPIYLDYLELVRLQSLLNSSRDKKFLETDKFKIMRKLYSVIFRVFSKKEFK